MLIKSYALAIVAIFALLHPQIANSASDANVRCVQEMLVNVGYDAGAADGVLGKRTNNAIKNYIQTQSQENSNLAVLVKQTGNFGKKNAESWCQYLKKHHPSKRIANKILWRINQSDNGDTWLLKLQKGWKVRISGFQANTQPKHIAIFAHGDGTDPKIGYSNLIFKNNKYGYFNRQCQRFSSQMPSDTIFACIFRPYADNARKRRQPFVISEFSEVVRTLQTIWPSTLTHCDGHSGGGHLCLALSQQKDTNLTCLIATAPASAVLLHSKINNIKRGRSLSRTQRSAYDPVDYVAKTKAREITILGDHKDPIVDYRVWDAFINAAGKHGIPVKYIETPGAKHGNQIFGIMEMARCIRRQTTTE